METQGQKNDGALLTAFVKNHDDSAFAVVVQRHAMMVLSVCRRVVVSRQDAEDAAQAVFLTLAKKAGSLIGSETVAPWLHHVAYLISINAWKARRSRMERERKAGEDMDKFASSDQSDNVELNQLLVCEMEAMPEKYRRALILFHLEEQTLEDVARQCETSVGTAGSWLSRGRELLRKRLVRRGVTVSAAALVGLLSAEAGATPPDFVNTAVTAASAFAAGTVATCNTAISTKIIIMAKGATKMMFYAKMKLVAMLILLGIIGTTELIHAQDPKTVKIFISKEGKADIAGTVLSPTTMGFTTMGFNKKSL